MDSYGTGVFLLFDVIAAGFPLWIHATAWAWHRVLSIPSLQCRWCHALFGHRLMFINQCITQVAPAVTQSCLLSYNREYNATDAKTWTPFDIPRGLDAWHQVFCPWAMASVIVTLLAYFMMVWEIVGWEARRFQRSYLQGAFMPKSAHKNTMSKLQQEMLKQISETSGKFVAPVLICNMTLHYFTSYARYMSRHNHGTISTPLWSHTFCMGFRCNGLPAHGKQG